MNLKLIENLKCKLKRDEHFSELVRGTGVAFVLRILGIIFGYLFTLAVTRTLGAEAWGIFALCSVVLQISSVIGRLGMDTALLRFTAEYMVKGRLDILKDVYKKVLILVVPVSVMVALLVYFLSPVLAVFVFKKSYLIPYFRVVSVAIVPFVLLWIHSEAIRGLKKVKEYMLFQQVGVYGLALIFLMMGVFFIGRRLDLPIVSYILAVTLLFIGAVLLWRRYLSLHQMFNSALDKKISYRRLLSVSIPMLFSSSLALLMGWTDTIMLGMFRNAKEVGVYNVALRLSMVTSIMLMAINTIAAPKFAEFWGRRDIEGLARVAQQSTKLIFWSSFPVLLLFLIFSKPILGIFGREFEVGAVALMILTVGQFVNAFVGSVGYILQMTNKQMVFQNVVLFAAILNVGSSLILIPKLGIIGAAIANTIAVCFINIVLFLLVRYYYGFFTVSISRRGG